MLYENVYELMCSGKPQGETQLMYVTVQSMNNWKIYLVFIIHAYDNNNHLLFSIHIALSYTGYFIKSLNYYGDYYCNLEMIIIMITIINNNNNKRNRWWFIYGIYMERIEKVGERETIIIVKSLWIKGEDCHVIFIITHL